MVSLNRNHAFSFSPGSTPYTNPPQNKPKKHALRRYLFEPEEPTPSDYYKPADRDDLVQESWYHGNISYRESQTRLQRAPSGSYLVRESASHEGCYSLDVKHKGSMKHFIIQENDWDEYEVTGAEKSFETLPLLVTYYSSNVLSAEGEMLHTPLPAPRMQDETIVESDHDSSGYDSENNEETDNAVEGMHNAL